MVKKKTWEEFQEAGLFWYINMILHLLGWAIVYETKEDEIIRVYPARVKFRGFAEQCNTEGYIKVSKFLKNNITELTEEAES